MKPNGVLVVLLLITFAHRNEGQCTGHQSMTFVRLTGVTSERAAPVFVYSASGEEESLAGACLARCRELDDCAAVVVAYGRGNCHGVADSSDKQLKMDNDVSYFKKICLELPTECSSRWWALESTPGYHLHAEDSNLKVILNTTLDECYTAALSSNGDKLSRSAQWIGADSEFDSELITISNTAIGNCILNSENKFTEPESYRVSNYYTFYIENQCRHDYLKKIDRCSYEEYYNQTLKHVEFTVKNYTKDECKTACETEERFICRGFTWTSRGYTRGGDERGLCDLHSEDLVTTGSWLLRRISTATYYRRVICLNLSVECEGSDLVVTYRPRGMFRGRVYVPGRGERCSARADTHTRVVRLSLPLYGDCDVHYAHAISNGPAGMINRTMAYVMVMIQNNPIIQTAGDRWVRVGCSPGARAAAAHVDAIVAVTDNMKPSPASVSPPAAASAVFSTSSSPLTVYVVRAHETAGTGAGGAVALGEPLELRIETTGKVEIEAYHLVASSRLGDSSVLLLDSRGCPTGQVDFPPFTRSWLNGTQRLFAKFKAFRFPTSHVVRFALMVRFCDDKCTAVNCGAKQQGRTARDTNETTWDNNATVTSVQEEGTRVGVSNVVAQGGAAGCAGAGAGQVPLELEMVVGSRDILSADTLIRADHRATTPEGSMLGDGPMVCVHELLLLALALAWLAVQVLLLLGCCILVKSFQKSSSQNQQAEATVSSSYLSRNRQTLGYRNLAEMSMQKEYQSFDNVGFDTVSTHRRVHWPDQNIDILHAT